MKFRHVTIIGQDVSDKIEALKASSVAASSTRPGCFESESLCRFQEKMSRSGHLPAEIVNSNYGYSVRYASGLQNFGIIFGSRNGQLDGSREDAIAKATSWQKADPARRYVTELQEVED